MRINVNRILNKEAKTKFKLSHPPYCNDAIQIKCDSSGKDRGTGRGGKKRGVEGSMKHYKEPMTKPRRLGRE